jgi:hypothetical protein
MPEKKYLPLEKIEKLQDSIGFLDTYKPVAGEEHFVANSMDAMVDIEMTVALRKLGEINKQRDELIYKIYYKKY